MKAARAQDRKNKKDRELLKPASLHKELGFEWLANEFVRSG